MFEVAEKVVNDKPAYKPWTTAYCCDDFGNWLQWMQSEQSFQTPLYTINAGDAYRLYQIMSRMTWECHRNHSLLTVKREEVPLG